MIERRRLASVLAVSLCAAALTACGQGQNPRARASDMGVQYAAAPAPADLTADALLAAELISALKVDPITRDADIQVVVASGRARLSGFVQNAAAKLRAAELAQQARGIVAVDNRLILRYHADMSANPLGDARVRL